MLALRFLFYNSFLLGVTLSTYAVYFCSKTQGLSPGAGFRLLRNFSYFIVTSVLIMHVFQLQTKVLLCSIYTAERTT